MLSLLGFSTSCEEKNKSMMYGVPMAGFKVIGKVESALDGKPIPDIIIEARENYLAGSGFSKPDGTYEVRIGDYPGDHTYHLKFVDTDGALNGEYESQDTTVVFKDPKYTGGDGSWYSGVAEQELNVKLTPKK
jgi:putative lipoprotein (rSAM/lipoprotein system)